MELYPTQRAHNWAKPGLDQVPIWETTIHWVLGLLAEAAEEAEKPMAWAEPPEQAVTILLLQPRVCCY